MRFTSLRLQSARTGRTRVTHPTGRRRDDCLKFGNEQENGFCSRTEQRQSQAPWTPTTEQRRFSANGCGQSGCHIRGVITPPASHREHHSRNGRSTALQRQTESQQRICTMGRFDDASLLDEFWQLDLYGENSRSGNCLTNRTI